MGYVVEVNSPHTIAEGIIDFYEKDRYEYMVRNAKKHKKGFSWDKFVRAIGELVED